MMRSFVLGVSVMALLAASGFAGKGEWENAEASSATQSAQSGLPDEMWLEIEGHLCDETDLDALALVSRQTHRVVEDHRTRDFAQRLLAYTPPRSILPSPLKWGDNAMAKAHVIARYRHAFFPVNIDPSTFHLRVQSLMGLGEDKVEILSRHVDTWTKLDPHEFFDGVVEASKGIAIEDLDQAMSRTERLMRAFGLDSGYVSLMKQMLFMSDEIYEEVLKAREGLWANPVQAIHVLNYLERLNTYSPELSLAICANAGRLFRADLDHNWRLRLLDYGYQHLSAQQVQALADTHEVWFRVGLSPQCQQFVVQELAKVDAEKICAASALVDPVVQVMGPTGRNEEGFLAIVETVTEQSAQSANRFVERWPSLKTAFAEEGMTAEDLSNLFRALVTLDEEALADLSNDWPGIRSTLAGITASPSQVARIFSVLAPLQRQNRMAAMTLFIMANSTELDESNERGEAIMANDAAKDVFGTLMIMWHLEALRNTMACGLDSAVGSVVTDVFATE